VCIWLAEDKRPAARRRRQPEQHPQRRGLASTVRAQEPRDGPRLERKGEIVNGDERPEPLRQRFGYDRRRHPPSLPTRDFSFSLLIDPASVDMLVGPTGASEVIV
jgi:hypothetical protein